MTPAGIDGRVNVALIPSVEERNLSRATLEAVKAQYGKTSPANAIDGGHFPAPLAAEPVSVSFQVLGRKRQEDGSFVRIPEAREDGKAATLTTVEARRMVAIPLNTTTDGKAQCLRATCYKDGVRNLIANEVDRRTCVAEPVRIGTIESDTAHPDNDSQQYTVTVTKS